MHANNPDTKSSSLPGVWIESDASNGLRMWYTVGIADELAGQQVSKEINKIL